MRNLIFLILVATSGISARAQSAPPRDPGDVRDLPLVEVPARDAGSPGSVLAVLLSGDGGWASIDRQIAGELAAHGVSVVGFNLKEYLGTERTPSETAAAVERVLRAYGQRWHRDRLVIVGFSRGANIAPFVVARLAGDLRSRIELVALVGLAQAANFKWHWQDVFRDVKRPSDVPVEPELERIAGMRTICIYGADEKDSGCRSAPPGVKRIERPGGHHMDGDYKAVGDLVFDAIPR